MEDREHQFLYQDGDGFHFMNPESFEQVTLTSDEGNRPDTTLEGLAALKPVREGRFISAGNASQLSDGASACVVMDAKLAERR